MPRSGRRPQAEVLSPRRTAYHWTEVEDTPNRSGPQLPKLRANGLEWPEHIRSKWNSWKAMPHARTWQPSDWSFAMDSLEVACRFYETGTAALASELRLRERVMGCSHDARVSLRIRYVAPRPALATVRRVTAIGPDDFSEL